MSEEADKAGQSSPEAEVTVLRSGKKVDRALADATEVSGKDLDQKDDSEAEYKPEKEVDDQPHPEENGEGNGRPEGDPNVENTDGPAEGKDTPSKVQPDGEVDWAAQGASNDQEGGDAAEDEKQADGGSGGLEADDKGDAGEGGERRSSRERDRERKSDRKEKGKDRDRDRERGKDRDRDGGSKRERDRSQERDRERGGKDKDRERERGRDREGKRSRDDDRGGKEAKRSRRSRSRERSREVEKEGKESKRSRRSRSREKSKSRRDSRSRRSSRERRSSRSSPSKSRRRSRSRGRRRSPSRDRHRRRSRSRGRGHRSRRRSYDSDSDDGFGGYVPRKRQEVPQAASGIANTFVDPYANLRSKQPLPTDPEGIKRAVAEQQLRARQMVLQQQATSAVAAASKTQREIYVGNLVQGLVNEEALRQLFNTTMRAAFPEQQVAGLDPVVTASMHSEGRYAFVELRTPEMASAALQLSGQVQLLGQNISVGRPSGFVDPSAAQMAAAQAATALQSFELGQTTLEAATEAMNTITTVSLPGLSASRPPEASPMMALPPPPAGVTPPGPAGVTSPLASVQTPFLQVVGMVTAEVLTDDEEYAEVIEDLKEECGKFGQLLGVVVPRPPVPAQSAQLFGQGNFGKAYVHFADPNQCRAAKEAIHGRMFAGVALQATFAGQADFEAAKRDAPLATNPV